MIKLCIFDLDGTVLDTVGTIAYYANQALEKTGLSPLKKSSIIFWQGGELPTLCAEC